MKSDGQMNQNTERARIRYMRQNAPEYARRRIYGGIVLALLALSFCRFGAPAYAQAPIVTPLPGPVATATAAAAQMQQAQAQQAQANQQIAQGQQAAAAASASFAAAQKDASDARAALAAQQAQAVGEAIGRAEANIEAGQQQINTMSAVIPQLRDTINAQAATVAQQGAELQQVRAENSQLKTINAALMANNETLTAQAKDNNRASGVSSYATLFVAIVALIVLVGVPVAIVLQRKRAVVIEPPPAGFDTSGATDGEYTDSAAQESGV